MRMPGGGGKSPKVPQNFQTYFSRAIKAQNSEIPDISLAGMNR